jgi:hypothetical protein
MKKNGFTPIIIVLIIAFLGGIGYLAVKFGQVKLTKPVEFIKQTSTPDPTADWKIFRNEKGTLQFKYPPDFFVDQEMDMSVVSSKPVFCKTGITGSEKEVTVSEVYIRADLRFGTSYEDIWRKTIGSEFNTDSPPYDGVTIISGKKGYYIYSGAESLKSKKTILVDLSNQRALNIIIETPLLVYDCSAPIDQYKGVADQILSTFSFIKN